MTSSVKNIIIILILIVVVFVGSILSWAFLGSKYYQIKKSPFYDLYISQENTTIRFSGVANGSGDIEQRIDYNKKKIIFTITGSLEKIKSDYYFPVNGNIGYDMCYNNKYGEYCFGKTK